MTSEKYEFEYCNLVKANEAANKYSIIRQYKMIADIRELQTKYKRLKEAYNEICETYIPLELMSEANNRLILLLKPKDEQMGRDLLKEGR